MKIKMSKSQWEEMGKKAGWVRTANSPSGKHYEIRVEGGLLHKANDLPEANKQYERTLKDNWEDEDYYYLVEVTQKVLRAEHARRKG